MVADEFKEGFVSVNKGTVAELMSMVNDSLEEANDLLSSGGDDDIRIWVENHTGTLDKIRGMFSGFDL